MASIIAEFSYWSYGEYSKSAMLPRPEVNASDVESIARRYAVRVEVKQVSPRFFMLGRIPSRYRKTSLKVMGESANEVRSCVREIILLYGRPDEVPFSFSTARRAGRTIIQSLLKDYPGR